MIRVDEEPIAWEVDLLDHGFLGVHNISFDQNGKNSHPGNNYLK